MALARYRIALTRCGSDHPSSRIILPSYAGSICSHGSNERASREDVSSINISQRLHSKTRDMYMTVPYSSLGGQCPRIHRCSALSTISSRIQPRCFLGYLLCIHNAILFSLMSSRTETFPPRVVLPPFRFILLCCTAIQSHRPSPTRTDQNKNNERRTTKTIQREKRGKYSQRP